MEGTKRYKNIQKQDPGGIGGTKKRKILENRLDSAPYEWGIEITPQIDSAEKL